MLDVFQDMWTTPEVGAKLRQLDDLEIDELYSTYLDRLTARPKMDFKSVIEDLVLQMHYAMRTKAEKKAGVKAEKVTKANKPLTKRNKPLAEQTEDIYKELRARRLKRKCDLDGDGTGAHEPKVASSSTSGLGQGSEGSSTLAHQK